MRGMKLNLRLTVLLMSIIYVLHGQDGYPQGFISPVKHPIVLSGSFGELRNAHFHAGIDIKPVNMGVDGDSLYAVYSGYVSRIRIDRAGYGKSLEITHPNGYTSVYAHLFDFHEGIEKYIREKQRDSESYEVDVFPKEGKFQFEKGEFIGRMGNTGFSFGTHLHFELRDTETGRYINPKLMGLKPQDKIAPSIVSVTVWGFDGEFRTVSKNNMVNKPGNGSKKVVVSAEFAGISVEAFDRMTGASNKNGVFDISLYVDGELYYQSKMEELENGLKKMYYAYTNYDSRKNDQRAEINCFLMPGARQPGFKKINNQGFILMDSEEKELRIVASDLEGNQSEMKITLQRGDQKLEAIQDSTSIILSYLQEDTLIRRQDLEIKYRKGTLHRNTAFKAYVDFIPYANPTIYIGSENEAIFENIGISLKLPELSSTQSHNLYFVHSGNTAYPVVCRGDWLECEVSSFGNYKVIKDTIPPTITAVKFSKNAVGMKEFRFTIKDNINVVGNKFRYKTYINEVWVPSEFKQLTHTLSIPLDSANTGENSLKIVAMDAGGNEAVYESIFRI
jgi:murein DD-endopeptidase MepM/ murein hydrolase activator NlpD